MKKMVQLAVLAVLLSATAGCGTASEREAATSQSEHVIPGAPKGPSSAIGGDWFSRGRQAETRMTLNALSKQISMQVRAREGGAGANTAALLGITIQDKQYVGDGVELEGYTLRYSDRITLTVSPCDAPYDLKTELASTVMTTTAGKTRLWHAVNIRGNVGAYREPAIQKWESGFVNKTPAVLEWVEPTQERPGFIRYAVVGDGPLQRLLEVADEIGSL